MDYSELDTEVLENLKTSEQEVLSSLEENLKEINKTLGDTDAGVGLWSAFCSNAAKFFTGKDDEYTLFNDSKAKLKEAKTVAEAEKAIETLKGRIQTQEEGFYGKSYSVKNFKDMTDDEKTTFRKAYDMAVQKKTIEAEAKEAGTDVPKVNIDFQQEIVDKYDPNDTSPTAISKQQYEEAKKVVEVYKDIKLDWMDGDDDEIKVYKANKSLMDQANTKLELLKSKEKTEKNLSDIQSELDKRS